MKKRYVVHDANGVILSRLTLPEFIAADYSLPEGQSMIEIEDEQLYEQTHFISSGALVPKRSFQLVIVDTTVAADGAQVLVIGNVPAGTAVKVEGPVQTNVTVDDGTLELTFVEPGEYQLTFSRQHYLDRKETIVAV